MFSFKTDTKKGKNIMVGEGAKNGKLILSH